MGSTDQRGTIIRGQLRGPPILKVEASQGDGILVARQLLRVVPQLLLEPGAIESELVEATANPYQSYSYPRKQEKIADCLIDLLNRCIIGDSVAVNIADQLVQNTKKRFYNFETSAAWDVFLRCLELSSSERVSWLVLDDQWSAYTPPLIRELTGHFTLPDNSSLAHADVLACRHLLGSTVSELVAIRTILPNARFREILGKPYSANREAVLKLKRLGFNVDQTSWQLQARDLSSLGAFSNTHRASMRDAVNRFLAEDSGKVDPLLIIDDGGALIDAVGQVVRSGRLSRPVVAIEQTTRGVFAVRSFLKEGAAHKNGFAIINVAESNAKLVRESPIIARSVVNEAWEWLHSFQKDFSNQAREMRFGVIGYGTVGSYVTAQLRQRSVNVRVYDRNRHKTAVADANGFPIAKSAEDLVRSADVIFCASNGTSIDTKTAEALKDGTVLISASSGDAEFRGLHTWSKHVSPIFPTSREANDFDKIHGLITATNDDGRRVYIPNGGFPVNFDGSIDPIKPSLIQLTRSLIVAAVMQAAGAGADSSSLVGKTGEFDLDEMLEDFIVDRFDSLSIRD